MKCVWCEAPAVRERAEERGPWEIAMIPECAAHEGGVTKEAPDPGYLYLDDPREREWLTGLDPQAVLANAHRIYDWMTEQGVMQDSFLRELAFTKTAEALDIDYDVLYDAWLNQTPAVSSLPCVPHATCGHRVRWTGRIVDGELILGTGCWVHITDDNGDAIPQEEPSR